MVIDKFHHQIQAIINRFARDWNENLLRAQELGFLGANPRLRLGKSPLYHSHPDFWRHLDQSRELDG